MGVRRHIPARSLRHLSAVVGLSVLPLPNYQHLDQLSVVPPGVPPSGPPPNTTIWLFS